MHNTTKPLTKDQNAALFTALRQAEAQGDAVRTASVRDAIARGNWAAIVWGYKRFNRGLRLTPDEESELGITLHRAIAAYDEATGCAFGTFVVASARLARLQHLRGCIRTLGTPFPVQTTKKG